MSLTNPEMVIFVALAEPACQIPGIDVSEMKRLPIAQPLADRSDPEL